MGSLDMGKMGLFNTLGKGVIQIIHVWPLHLLEALSAHLQFLPGDG